MPTLLFVFSVFRAFLVTSFPHIILLFCFCRCQLEIMTSECLYCGISMIQYIIALASINVRAEPDTFYSEEEHTA